MISGELTQLEFGSIDSVNIKGVDVELFQAGAGRPLLFLHGIDGLESAAEGLRELAKSYKVYAPSHPGFGTSGLPPEMDRVDDIGYFYLDLLDHLKLDAPVIVGTSFGAWVACEMLTKEPRRGQALVLTSPLGLKTADRRDHWVTDLFMISKEQLAERLQHSAPKNQSPLKWDEEQMRRALRADEALSVFGWTPYMSNPKLGDRLHRITCPTMVVWGEQDRMIHPTYRDRWREALPQAQVEILAGAGHRSHADKPTELIEMIDQFVTGETK